MVETQWGPIPWTSARVAPRVYTLMHSDPVQVQELLEGMFTTSSSTSRGSWWNRTTETTQSVGPLFGQFSFEGPPRQRQADRHRQEQRQLRRDRRADGRDRPAAAGRAAGAHRAQARQRRGRAEQLNATFAEAGTLAQLPRTERGLTRALRTSTRTTQSDSGGQQQREQPQQQQPEQQQRERQQRPRSDPLLVEPEPAAGGRAADQQPDRQAPLRAGQPPQRDHGARPAGRTCSRCGT